MDNYDVYEKYEDVLFKSKQKICKGKHHIYSSKHIRIKQLKAFKKKMNLKLSDIN